MFRFLKIKKAFFEKIEETFTEWLYLGKNIRNFFRKKF